MEERCFPRCVHGCCLIVLGNHRLHSEMNNEQFENDIGKDESSCCCVSRVSCGGVNSVYAIRNAYAPCTTKCRHGVHIFIHIPSRKTGKQAVVAGQMGGKERRKRIGRPTARHVRVTRNIRVGRARARALWIYVPSRERSIRAFNKNLCIFIRRRRRPTGHIN